MKHSLLLLFIFVAVAFLGSASLVLAGGPCSSSSECPVAGSALTETQCAYTPGSPPGCYCMNPGAGFPNCSNNVGTNLPNPLCFEGPGSANCVNDFPGLITKITTYIVSIIGSLAVLMFVWAGILFVTSAGKAGQVEKAKKVLFYAVIGAAIALAGTGFIAVVKGVIGEPPA